MKLFMSVSFPCKTRFWVGGREEEAIDYKIEVIISRHRGEYKKVKECLEKALGIILDIGDKIGEAEVYSDLEVVFVGLKEYNILSRPNSTWRWHAY